MIKRPVVWICLVCGLMAFAAQVQAEITEFKITAGDGAAYDYYGRDVSIDGYYAVVGSYRDDGYIGSVYILKWDGTDWIQETKLTASDGENDEFGFAVSISGDYVVIGAPSDDDNDAVQSGSAYIFKRDGTSWTQQAKLTPSDGAGEDKFGQYLSIDGDYVVISSYQDDDNGENSGSVYVFHRDGSTWSQQAKLTASNGDTEDLFGRSVAISGDYIIAGAPMSGSNSGSAYIFKRDGTTWNQDAILGSVSDAGDYFGLHVDIDGNYAVVASPLNDQNGTDSGTVYIYSGDSGWTLQQSIDPSDGDIEDYFGESIAISGDYVAIGATGDDGNENNSGSVYIFKRDGTNWDEQAKLTASDGVAGDEFGFGLSIDGDTILVGAHRNDGIDTDAGAAYIYDLGMITTLTLNPDNTAPAVGDSLCIDVGITDADALYSAAFDLTFDPAVLEYQSASEGDFLNSDGGTTFFEAALLNGDASNGIVVVGVSRVADIGEVSGSGTIATVCFTVIGGGGTDITVGLDNGYFEGSEQGKSIEINKGDDPVIPVEIEAPANLNVTDPGTLDQLNLSWDATSGAVSYEVYRTDASGGTAELIANTTATTYEDTDCILVNVAYYYSVKAVASSGSAGDFSAEVSGTAAGLSGDINKDNRVDGQDLTILARAYSTISTDSDYNCQADLDRTDAVDGDDLVILTTGFGDQL